MRCKVPGSPAYIDAPSPWFGTRSPNSLGTAISSLDEADMQDCERWLGVKHGTEIVPIERACFDLLFDNSHRRNYADIRTAKSTGTIGFTDLVKHARAAEIPWPLFFAPLPVVHAQVVRKTRLLLEGTSKTVFSMNSRNEVQLADVDLIVKDLLRKQQLLKRLDPTLVKNEVVGCLKFKRPRSVVEEATTLRGKLGLDLADLRSQKGKAKAFEHLIGAFEARQVYVSRNQPGCMLQQVPQGVRFSGLAVKDSKIPYLFLAAGDEGDFEPAGRKIFTLALLATLIGYGKFSPVTYEDKTGGGTTKREYDVAAELLMPADELKHLSVPTLDAARNHSDVFMVTPSAFVMRAWTLGLIGRDDADAWLAELERAYRSREKKATPMQVNRENAVRRYCGTDYFNRMVAVLAAGRIDAGNFRRNVCLNRLPLSRVRELGETAA